MNDALDFVIAFNQQISLPTLPESPELTRLKVGILKELQPLRDRAEAAVRAGCP